MRLSKEELDDVLKKNPDVTVYGAMLPPEHPLAGGGMMIKYVLNKPHSKYGAIKTEHNGVTYDSKAEARFAEELDLRVKAGQAKYWLRQIPFRLPAGVVYKCDFQIFYEPQILVGDGGCDIVEYVDVKGMDTPVSKLKRRQVESLYPVKIRVVK